jgi:hypothetical protein
MSTSTIHERPRIPIEDVSEFSVRVAADHAVPRRQSVASNAAVRAAFAQEVRPTAHLRNL